MRLGVGHGQIAQVASFSLQSFRAVSSEGNKCGLPDLWSECNARIVSFQFHPDPRIQGQVSGTKALQRLLLRPTGRYPIHTVQNSPEAQAKARPSQSKIEKGLFCIK